MNRRAPRPGPLLRAIARVRIDSRAWQRLRDELDELHEHRESTSGRDAADRWLRREYRRLTLKLLLGARLGREAGTPSTSSGALSGIGRDLRHSLRGLRRAPTFSLATAVTLGLGIGGTSLVFAIVHAVLISPLPYPGADRMVLMRTVQGGEMWGTSMADVHALTETPPPAFDRIETYTRRTARLTRDGEVDLVPVKHVTPGYFRLLGLDPIEGRHFLEDEGRPGGDPAVLIRQSFRDRTFAPGAEVLGRTLTLNGVQVVIVGVLPDRLGPLDVETEIFPALVVDVPGRKGPFFYPTVARLGEGVDPELARTQLAALSERIYPLWQSSFPDPDAVLGFVPLKEFLVGDVRRTLFMVLAAVGALLLIAGANASSLLVARVVTRSRELGIRSALGASRGRVVRLLLSEAFLLAGGAALLGLAIVLGGLELVRRLGVGRLPRVEELAITPEALGFFLLVALGSWILLGLIAAPAARRNATGGIASSSGRATTSRGMLLLRRTLAGAQFALTIPLLVGATLLIASLGHVQSEGYGFDPEGVVSVLVTLPGESFDSDGVRQFWAATLPEIEALPGVLAAGIADARPPLPIGGGNNFVLEGQPPTPGAPANVTPWITADPGFFRTLGLRLVEGRIYDAPATDTMRYAVVDQAWAARYSPDTSPLGLRMRSGGCTVEGCPWTEIVGVVSDVKTSGLDDTRGRGTIYFDFTRAPFSSMRLHLRVQGDPLAAIPGVRGVIRSRGEGIPVAEVTRVEELADEALAGRRYSSTLVTLLAATALLLSVVGVYGVMAYYVRQHVREIGIRIALGGGPGSALRMVLRRGMTVAGVGTLLGLLATPLLTRSISASLYGVEAGDPRVLTAVVIATLVVAFVATAVPGRAAARTDPATTLREE